MGHDSISVTPVIDGISLLKNSMKTNYCGQVFNDQIADLLLTNFPNLTLIISIKSKQKLLQSIQKKASITVQRYYLMG